MTDLKRPKADSQDGGNEQETKRIPRKRRRRKKYRPWHGLLLLLLFVLVLVTMLAVARSRQKDTITPEIEAILREAAHDRAARAAAVERARKSIPPDAPISANWDFAKIPNQFRSLQHSVLMQCMVLVNGPSKDDLENILEARVTHDDQNPFYFSVEGATTVTDIDARLDRFLRGCKPLQEIEAALELGLLQDVVDQYRTPRDANLVEMCILLAGRASCELRAGEPTRALKTLLNGYNLAALIGSWPHVYGPVQRYHADSVLDHVLWRWADAGSIAPSDQERIVRALDTRKPVEAFAKTLRVHAANIEVGEESDYRGYPKLVGSGFAFTGRNALARMKQLTALLTTPPCQVREQIQAIAAPQWSGYCVNPLVNNACQAYRIHARQALMGDIARTAFALKTWRQARGKYPPSLDEVPVKLPADPLSGNPVIYYATDTGFSIAAPAAENYWPEQLWEARK